ncbi:MAG: hypothetical protein A4E31_00129 [Methanomassiliicoccales archaeon PtaU1.Bin030]|nr:MAG: hypothetical protein A4E31_00129 [Methanomassiliicoccales archaeon PtaU1.Bin030]
MNCVHCGRELHGKQERNCSKRCCDNASSYRTYYRRKLYQPGEAARTAERKRLYARAWRKRMVLEGRCSRCGYDNDRLDEGRRLCSSCYALLKVSR